MHSTSAHIALGDRSGFPTLAPVAYCNHAAISPPSTWVTEAVQASLADYARHGLGAFKAHLEQRQRLKTALARLIGGQPEDLALTGNTTTGVLAIANCMPWRSGDRVLTYAGEFPANVTPWQQAAETFAFTVELLPIDDFHREDGSAGLTRLEQELAAGGARLVAISAVQFQTGLAMPVRAIGELCHRYGAELFVDGIQAVGGRPLDVGEDHIDYLACGSHKWLMGLEGSGFLYIAPERIGCLEPRLAGWLSHDSGLEFLFQGPGHLRYDRPIRHEASFLEFGAPNALGCVALEAALGPILKLGPATIFEHIGRYLDDLEARLVQRGFRSLRAPDQARRSCILGVLPPPHLQLHLVQQALQQAGIATSIPDGVLRFAPHWPNGFHEPQAIDEVIGGLL